MPNLMPYDNFIKKYKIGYDQNFCIFKKKLFKYLNKNVKLKAIKLIL